MIALVLVSCSAVVVMGIALVFARSAAQRATNRAAHALADVVARDIVRAAEDKARAAGDTAVKEVEHATHEELERIARDLAHRK